MAFNTARVKRLIRRALARSGSVLADYGYNQKLLCEASTRRYPEAIFEPATLDRIDRVSPYRNWDNEQKMLRGDPMDYGPAVAFTVADMAIFGSQLYRGTAQEQVGFDDEVWRLTGTERVNRASATLTTSYSGSHFFACMLLDDFLTEMIAPVPQDNIRMNSMAYSHESPYRDLLQLPSPQLVTRGNVGELTIIDEPCVTDLKTERYRTLRQRLQAQTPAGNAPAGMFIRRGLTGEKRLLVNEPEIERWFESLGFFVVDPSTMSVQEIVQRTMGSPIVAGVEGSQLAHGIFSCADDARFLVLQPPDRFALQFKEFTDCMDMRYATLVGTPVEQGFEVDIAEIEQLLEQIS